MKIRQNDQNSQGSDNMRKHARLITAALIAVQTVFLCGASAETDCYILREYNGRIALFRESSPLPITVYETSPSALYPSDAELLAEGIRVKTDSEIARLIEDLELE